MDSEPSSARRRGARTAPAFVVVGALAVCSCSLFVDTSGFDGRAPADAGAGSFEASHDVADDAPSGDAPSEQCPDGGATSVECVTREIPTEGLVLWLRADDGVETTADGRVTAWRDGVAKLRPGYIGMNAVQNDPGAQPLRVVESTGSAVVFGPNDVLELPPGFEDFSKGLSVFAVIWPQFDAEGWAGHVFSLGYSEQVCGRSGELIAGSTAGYGFGYRVEAGVGETHNALDGRGWDVVSVVHGGWQSKSECSHAVPVRLRRATEVKATETIESLTKGVRAGSRLGRSVYYPTEYYNGKLGELLLYDRALDDQQVERVARYLGRRWPRP